MRFAIILDLIRVLFQIESFLKNNIAAVVPFVINKIYAVLKLVSSRCFKVK